MKKQNENEFIEFEEYYEHKSNENEEYEQDDDIKQNKEDFDEEREEMENDFELVKSLNELKEENKKLKNSLKFLEQRLETTENELEKALSESRIKDIELLEYQNKGKTPNSDYKKTMVQINNLNIQLEKYKTMFTDKKNEFSGLLEKYNEHQKTIDSFHLQEKKQKQELINKDKQIVKLLEEIEKKSLIVSNKANVANTDKEVERLNFELKKAEKQKNDVYIAFKKSLKLISILKRQKVHLENARLLAFTEEEFKQLLDQNNNNK